MKRTIILILLLSALLGGCSSSQQLENQAYAISMGLDAPKEGGIRITVQVPTIGGESGGGGGGSGGGGGGGSGGGESQTGSASGYSIYTASGTGFPEALELLQATIPRNLNLTQLKSIIFSETLARDKRFAAILDELMHIFQLSGNASFIVTRAEAKTLIENQKAHFGTRLSVSVPAQLTHYSGNGFISPHTLAEMYAGCHSVYSTTTAALADTAQGKPKGDLYDGNGALAGALSREGDNKNEYMGSALFDREKMVGVLNGNETQLMRLLAGTLTRCSYIHNQASMRLQLNASPDVKVDVNTNPIRIRVDINATVIPLTELPDIQSLKDALEREFMAVIDKCGQMGAEPFDFAFAASQKFASLEAWEQFDWLERFKHANVEINLRLAEG